MGQAMAEVVALLAIGILFGYLILNWGQIPEHIPMHFNAMGEINGWGLKSELLVLPVTTLIVYTLLTIISCFPVMWNVPIKITEENQESIYQTIKSMIIILKMEIVISFGYITLGSLKVGPLESYDLPLILIVIGGTILYYMIKIIQIGNKDR